MTAYPILTFVQSFIQFQMMVPEIQVKRAKHDIHTDQPSHRVSYKLTKKHALNFLIKKMLHVCYFLFTPYCDFW